MRMLSCCVLVVFQGAALFAQAPVPKGERPQFGLASAREEDGAVRIEVFELRDIARVKMPVGGDVFIEQRHWLELTRGTLGKDIRAYKPDGTRAGRVQVLSALAKPRGVVYFLGYDKAKPIEPDPFFLGLLKEGSIALAFDRPELAMPQP